jgi:hypothetical protein
VRFVGSLQRPGFEDKDSKVAESEADFFAVQMHEWYAMYVLYWYKRTNTDAKGAASYFEYYNEESSSASSCLWVRGEHAWYRLEKPAACYLEVYIYIYICIYIIYIYIYIYI